MQEQLISFETAKLAKEKGFKEVCNNYYSSDSLHRLCEGFNTNTNPRRSAPTQALLQKWLREKHKLTVDVTHELSMRWFYQINIIANKMEDYNHIFPVNDIFNTYEDALEEGLHEALKLIK